MRPKLRPDTAVLDAALREAEANGYSHITRESVAYRAGITPATINQRWGTMAQFRRAVMRHAVHTKNLRVVAQGLAMRDAHALRAPYELQRAAKGVL